MNKFFYSLELVKATLKVVFQNQKLLLFAFMSALCNTLLIAAFIVPLFFINTPSNGIHQPVLTQTSEQDVSAQSDAPPRTTDLVVTKIDDSKDWVRRLQKKAEQNPTAASAYAFLFYFSLYFLSVFFNTAIISCAVKVFSGERLSLREGLSTALGLVHYIFLWVLIASTVGVLLSVIQDRSNKFGQIMAGILGIVWSVATCFVVPVMAVQRISPFAAVSVSVDMLKKTWGENLIGQVSFGIFFGILKFVGFVLFMAGIIAGGKMAWVFLAGLVLYFVILESFRFLSEPVFLGALYLYSRDGVVPEGMPDHLLEGSFQSSEVL